MDLPKQKITPTLAGQAVSSASPIFTAPLPGALQDDLEKVKARWAEMQHHQSTSLFEHSDAVMFSGNDSRRLQAWLARGIIHTQHVPEGTGHLRKYTPLELLWILILVDLDGHHVEPLKLASRLAHLAAILFFSMPFDVVQGSRVIGTKHLQTGENTTGYKSADEAIRALGYPAILIDIFRYLPCVRILQDLIAVTCFRQGIRQDLVKIRAESVSERVG